jgi:hypothetical protein
VQFSIFSVIQQLFVLNTETEDEISGCFHGTETWKPRQPNINRNYEKAEEYDVRDVTVGDRYMERRHTEKGYCAAT